MGPSARELQMVLLEKVITAAEPVEEQDLVRWPWQIQAGTKEIGLLTSPLREDSFRSPNPSCVSSAPFFSFGSVLNKTSLLDITYSTHHVSAAWNNILMPLKKSSKLNWTKQENEMGKTHRLILLIRDAFASDKLLWGALVFNSTTASSRKCPTELFWLKF